MRKVFLMIALTALTVIGAKAQDLMTKRNGSELNISVIEISETDIKYRLFGDDSGPLRSIKTSELFRIKLKDGTVIVFDNTPPPPPPGGGDGYRKGYAGVGIGYSTLLADYSDLKSNGLQFNVNAGYLFKKHIGITGSFLLTSYKSEDYDDTSLGLRGGLVGPLISFQNSSLKVEYDIRPTVGLVSGKAKGKNASVSTDKMTFALGFGGSVRFHLSDLISLTGNLDTYFHGEFDEIESLASVGVSAGINFRF